MIMGTSLFVLGGGFLIAIVIGLLTGIFGIDGLRQLIQTALKRVPIENLSFMLEVHPQTGRSSLRDHAHLFAHWQDLNHAEQMNYWLDRLLDNVRLVRDTFVIH